METAPGRATIRHLSDCLWREGEESEVFVATVVVMAVVVAVVIVVVVGNY
ncbi:hypothetical protein E2C01_089521 [Portunus trituberculatus]|uniref:Uncharacterized protein n=1 Tax=Portunus trituberculatus TaxID=210409 RepID=A0A5B7JIF7_PORTR|nr:hypothetical protein [Portunus trituberculatus]